MSRPRIGDSILSVIPAGMTLTRKLRGRPRRGLDTVACAPPVLRRAFSTLRLCPAVVTLALDPMSSFWDERLVATIMEYKVSTHIKEQI